jgi:hypothetical protein
MNLSFLSRICLRILVRNIRPRIRYSQCLKSLSKQPHCTGSDYTRSGFVFEKKKFIIVYATGVAPFFAIFFGTFRSFAEVFPRGYLVEEPVPWTLRIPDLPVSQQFVVLLDESLLHSVLHELMYRLQLPLGGQLLRPIADHADPDADVVVAGGVCPHSRPPPALVSVSVAAYGEVVPNVVPSVGDLVHVLHLPHGVQAVGGGGTSRGDVAVVDDHVGDGVAHRFDQNWRAGVPFLASGQHQCGHGTYKTFSLNSLFVRICLQTSDNGACYTGKAMMKLLFTVFVGKRKCCRGRGEGEEIIEFDVAEM